ncbi:ankyrin repeat domain-containing protein [Wohlfahrtiimonas populi]|uniref:ankyrin repeat domain-containing protein n=1 Tax=Wohlfahrtiimonas populi TaxID=1940240 RepID=UPI00098D5880|nr:ankyrin repeat domain-containing protein [Wohlfahrtiimonas populi]
MKLKTALLTTTLLGLFTFAQAKTLNENNPEGYQQFRLDYAEMTDLANDNKLPHRNFYAKPSEGPDAAWFDAVKQGDLETVKQMVDAGQIIEVKDVGSLNQTALGWAAFIGYEDMVDYLLSKNANLWATDKGDVYHALKSAALGKNANIVKKLRELLKYGYDINDVSYEDDGETLVMVAASNNRMDVVKYLISQGVDLNKVTTIQDPKRISYNQSALSYACLRDYKEMQQLLIENGAINHRTGTTKCD